jgi:hypothetical protein
MYWPLLLCSPVFVCLPLPLEAQRYIPPAKDCPPFGSLVTTMITTVDQAGIMSGARLHVFYSTSLPPPTSLQITPMISNVVITENLVQALGFL